jgi:hypothetical protein
MSASQLWLRRYLDAMIGKGMIGQKAQRVMNLTPVA